MVPKKMTEAASKVLAKELTLRRAAEIYEFILHLTSPQSKKNLLEKDAKEKSKTDQRAEKEEINSDDKENMKKKKNKRTPGLKIKSSSAKQRDWHCIYCSEKFIHPPLEDWIQCHACKEWCHEKCADMGGKKGPYICDLCIGPIKESTCQMDGKLAQENNNIAIHVTPPDGEEDDVFVPPLRLRRKLSTPLSGIPGSIDGLNPTELLRLSPRRCLSPLDRTKRRFSTMVSSAAAAAVSRRLSATIEWCLATPTQVKPQIVRQGRALCLQYIKTQIRRSSSCVNKQIVLKRLQRMLETECGEEATNNIETGVLAALRALCAALERKRPEAFRHVARQAARTPSTILRSDTALAELTLALARRITRENITWSKIAAVYCICGALAREAAEASDEPPLELLSSPAAAIADLLHEEPGSWIASHGGWNGLIERLRISERDQRSEKMLRVMVSFFAMACCFLLLLRWVIHAHPAYYE